jgi:hypothetical protein
LAHQGDAEGGPGLQAEHFEEDWVSFFISPEEISVVSSATVSGHDDI